MPYSHSDKAVYITEHCCEPETPPKGGVENAAVLINIVTAALGVGVVLVTGPLIG